MKKGNMILLLITAGFLCVLLGIFVGRNLQPSHRGTVYDSTVAPMTSDPAYEDGKININKAGVTELVQLPGIGEGIAKRIVAYRTENGPFRSVEDLLNVEGIGTGRLEGLIDYITVGG